MRYSGILLVLSILFLAGCAAPGGFPPGTPGETAKVPEGKVIELSLRPGDFAVEAVEFHVDVEAVPASVLKRAKELLTEGAEIQDCEIEYQQGRKYFEVAAKTGGRTQEVLLTPEGEAVEWELEVAPEAVPEAVAVRAGGVLKGAVMRKCEQILDGKQKILAYHFKMDKGGMHYKVVVPIGTGASVVVYRETPAEIEVPVR